jgi:hypothetical protein
MSADENLLSKIQEVRTVEDVEQVNLGLSKGWVILMITESSTVGKMQQKQPCYISHGKAEGIAGLIKPTKSKISIIYRPPHGGLFCFPQSSERITAIRGG